MPDLDELTRDFNLALRGLVGEARRKEIRRYAGLGISNAQNPTDRAFWVVVFEAAERESRECEREDAALANIPVESGAEEP